MVIVLEEMDTVIQIQILDKAACILLSYLCLLKRHESISSLPYNQ